MSATFDSDTIQTFISHVERSRLGLTVKSVTETSSGFRLEGQRRADEQAVIISVDADDSDEECMAAEVQVRIGAGHSSGVGVGESAVGATVNGLAQALSGFEPQL